MAQTSNKLDQALKDLIEAYAELDEELSEKFSDDEEAYTSTMTELLETSIEGALEDQDVEPKYFANLLEFLSDSLELLDPTVFDTAEGEEEEEEDSDYDDIDYDDIDDEEGEEDESDE
jgi:hypothetical protein